MTATNLEVVMDADGHIFEDGDAISEFLPPLYKQRGPYSAMGLFPPLDHMHSAHFVQTPSAGRGKVGPDEWLGFLDDVGIDSTVLYPTVALAYGKIVSHDWAIAVTRAYNDWLYDFCQTDTARLLGAGMISVYDIQDAVAEARRAVHEPGCLRNRNLPLPPCPAT